MKGSSALWIVFIFLLLLLAAAYNPAQLIPNQTRFFDPVVNGMAITGNTQLYGAGTWPASQVVEFSSGNVAVPQHDSGSCQVELYGAYWDGSCAKNSQFITLQGEFLSTVNSVSCVVSIPETMTFSCPGTPNPNFAVAPNEWRGDVSIILYAEPEMDCYDYCSTQQHAQCTGHWDVSGTYPNCSCGWECEEQDIFSIIISFFTNLWNTIMAWVTGGII